MDTTSYELYRDQMQTGDLIAFSGRGLFSWVIQWQTHSPYSHVGLVVRLSEAGTQRVFLLHAILGQGVVLLPLSRYLGRHQGSAWWVPLRHEEARAVNPTYRSDLLGYTLQQLGRGYDLKGVLRFLLPFIPASAGQNFCSELAAEAYRASRLRSDTFVSPAYLLRWSMLGQSVSLV